VPWKFYTVAEMGSDPTGQSSASVDSQYNSVPSSGFVSLIIPFFSGTYLPEEKGPFSEVTDHRPLMYEVTSGKVKPNFYCIRLSWDGEQVHQVCDPNDEAGDTTVVVSEAVLQFFQKL
jgi:hypothetical protein